MLAFNALQPSSGCTPSLVVLPGEPQLVLAFFDVTARYLSSVFCVLCVVSRIWSYGPQNQHRRAEGVSWRRV